MSAIATELPEDVRAARDGVLAFVDKEVIPRHADHKAFFEDPRALYCEDGRFSPRLVAIINEVRQASAAAGFSVASTWTASARPSAVSSYR